MISTLPQLRAESVGGAPVLGADAWRSAEVEAARGLAAAALFLEHLAEIDEICETAGRRGGLSPADVEDFGSWARLRLIENDYAVVRRFLGRGEFGHFLSVTLHNLLRDYRTRLWGRWRPSAAARRQGCAAEHLEMLVLRDGFSLDEAEEIVLRSDPMSGGREYLRDLAEALPRSCRPEMLGGDLILSLAGDGDAEERMNGGRRREAASRLSQAVAFAMRGLDATDRRLLKWHFQDGVPLARAAADLGVSRRSVYRRRDRCLTYLRDFLETLGFRWAEVQELLGGEVGDLGLDRLAGAAPDSVARAEVSRRRVDAA